MKCLRLIMKLVTAAKEMSQNDVANKFTCTALCTKQRLWERAFDLFNSSNPVASSYKAPLRPSTFQTQRNIMEAVARELMGLTPESGKPVVEDGRRMSLIFLAFTLKNMSLLTKMVFDAELCR
ncbi:hypothetical protein HPB48_025964 [Haemaphysalis longicornis]|uniref:Uncharacterized protein n=1 Tax=Haemaphysalis longicornis TaxID=44386 RepID=A0A9J6H8F3_HAELO|nr:hypothetical protein HPB48_025964 [Haemaphysalis longicornis]